MSRFRRQSPPLRRHACFLLVLFGAVAGLRAQNATILDVENTVQTSRGGTGAWQAAASGQSLAVGDRLRTRQRSRATVRLSELYTLRMNQFTTIEITPGLVGASKPRLDLASGSAFIFSREQGGEIDITTPAANAALRGTQLFVAAPAAGRTVVQVIEGEVELSNRQGKLVLQPGEAGEVQAGQAPRRTAVIEARNLLQWALYYPAVIDPADLDFGAGERRSLARSLDAYQAGDLLGALGAHPGGAAGSVGGRVYWAGVLLAVGRLDEAEPLLRGVPAGHPGRRALERMIAAVKFQQVGDEAGGSASELMAESYYLQSRSQLEEARAAARRATEVAPGNGYAWTRLAELEFSFGRLAEARTALGRALELAPRNARAHALDGFVWAGRNRLNEARAAFERAVALDGALGSGWLGLGLTKIRRGEAAAGRADLQTAATVEPGTSVYHSYLGKAFSNEGLAEDARRDLDLARQLDPQDPTPWLYSALELQQRNRPNEAIADLERSIELNDNRRVYRSRYLLDQDRAVRSANLARIYQNAGMTEVAVREATRAVEADYTNASAHLFLANAFDALRDPTRTQLRYETPWFNELLLANLLSPVGGGPLSQFISQQEYSKLLEEEGLGASFLGEWRSDPGELRAAASVFGNWGDFGFGIDAYHRDDDGTRPNADGDLDEIYAQAKWQVTPDDVLYFLGKWADQEGGDTFQTYDNEPLAPGLRFEETQEPGLLLVGWNHRWKPGVNTLFLAGRLDAGQRLTDPASTQLLVRRSTDGLRPGFIQTNPDGFDEFTDPALRDAVPPAVDTAPDGSLVYSDALLAAIAPYLGLGAIERVRDGTFDFATRRDFEIYTAEFQHIVQSGSNTLLAGGRWQGGEFRTDTRLLVERPTRIGGFATPAAEQHSVTDFDRLTAYVYDYWEVVPSLTLIGGLAWDRIDHPDNFRNPPVNDDQREEEGFSGKAGFSWTPSRKFALRGAFAEGLGGVTFDESVRLEPVQIAGFNQAFRTVISESLVGSVETPEYQTWGLSADGAIGARSWWGIAWQSIQQDVDRTLGVFTGYDSDVFPVVPAYFAGGLEQRLDYREDRLALTWNQLLGDEFSVGARYVYTRSELGVAYPELAGAAVPSVLPARLEDRATLHEIGLFANWNSPSGWFARAEANWFAQQLDDDPRGRPPGAARRDDDEFVQFNAFAGYRFLRNQCEVSAGVLNIGDQDYRLSPLTPYPELARERTFVLRCRLSF